MELSARDPQFLQHGHQALLAQEPLLVLLQLDVQRSLESDFLEPFQGRSEVDLAFSDGEVEIELQVVVADVAAHDPIGEGPDEWLRPSG